MTHAGLPLSVADAPADRAFRCSTASRERGEPLAATASTVPAFLLLEDPGPWGPAVLTCHRVPGRVRRLAAAWEQDLGIRPLLIRRPGRSTPGPRRVFVANAVHGWCQTALVDSLDDVAELDLSAAISPTGVGLAPHPDPLLLVCTHGRHDACCAERGRPLAAALAKRWPGFVWESSHLGGDRFAANLVTLPDGHYYGRLEPEGAPGIVERHLAGHLDLDHHRGLATRPWVAQAAEAAVRRRLGETRVDAVRTRVQRRGRGWAEVEVTVGGERCVERVDVGRAPAELLTCTSPSPKGAPTYRVGDASPG